MRTLSAPQRRRRLAVIAGMTLGGAVALVILVVRLAASPDVTANLGSDTFEVGRADNLARAIERDRFPLLFQDLRNGDLDIYVHHTGTNIDEGWVAVEARTDSRRCRVEWVAARQRFRDECSGRTYPPDGAGLRRFAVDVEDGFVTVDLRAKPPGD